MSRRSRSVLVVPLLAAACGARPEAPPPRAPSAAAPSAAAPAPFAPEPAAAPEPEAGLDPLLTSYAYPFDVRTFALSSQRQDLTMAYMDVASDKPNGRAVLLLHGKNFSGAYWADTIRALTAEGYRVIVPDQIGFGKSSKPATYQFTFQVLADNTRQLLDALSVQRVAVVGHSMGGMLATRFALMFPDRTASLTLVNPIGLEDWKTVVPYHSVEQVYAEELKATPDSIREYQKKSYFAGQWRPEYEKLIEIKSGWTQNAGYPSVAWCSALTYDMIFTQPVLYEFPQLRTPTLLIIGQRDRTALGKAWVDKDVAAKLGNYPVLGKQAARAIPGAKLVEIPGVGHLPQVEAFDTYSRALVGFLAAQKR